MTTDMTPVYNQTSYFLKSVEKVKASGKFRFHSVEHSTLDLKVSIVDPIIGNINTA